MQVTIIGAGNMGRGIGTRLVAGGHDVLMLDRDPEDARNLASELEAAGDGSARAGEPGDDPVGDVVFLAVYYDSARELAREYGERFAGKVVVDITNPVNVETFDGLVTPTDSSAAEELDKQIESAPVVKAFNTTFAGTLVDGEVRGQSLDVFIAGDDEGAKGKVAALARSGGLNPIDAGPLRRARELERLGFLHMALQNQLGTEYGSAIKVLQ